MASTRGQIRKRARMRKLRNPKLFGIKQAIQRKRMQRRIENAKSIPQRGPNGKVLSPNSQQRRRRRFQVGLPKNRNYAQRGLAAKQAYGLVPVTLADGDD